MVLTFPLGSRADLRLLEQHHAPPLFKCIDANRDYLRPWLKWVDATKTVDDTASFIDMALRQFANNMGFHAGIFVNGEPVGGVGFHEIDWSNFKSSIGYWIAENYQRQGLVTRACEAIIDHAFKIWNLNRIEIRCALDNERSRAVARRLRFIEEGVRRQYEYTGGMFRDLVIYVILNSEWNAR